MGRYLYWIRLSILLGALAISGNAICCEKESAQLSRFYELGDLVYETYQQNKLGKSKLLANEYLSLADSHKCDWNYGNAIHDANSFLGMISLSEKNIPAAKKYLIAAGKSQGSPQLDSFGPDFFLANALLSLGEKETVVRYLLGVKQFWNEDALVETWISDIKDGKVPELDREAGFIDTVMNQLYWLFPVLITFAYWIALKKTLTNMWAYPVSSLMVGYSVMIAIDWYARVFINYLAEVIVADYAFYFLIVLSAFIEFVVPILTMLLVVHLFKRKVV